MAVALSEEMAEYRVPYLLAGIACMCFAACGLAGVLLNIAAAYHCSEDLAANIGHFDSKEAGVRAAIPKLAAEIARCPDARVFRISWTGPGNYPQEYRHAVVYVPKSNRIGYEDDYLSGLSEAPYAADEAAIRAVAERGGTLADFARPDPASR